MARITPDGRIALTGWIGLVGWVILEGFVIVVHMGRFGLTWAVGLY